MNESSFDWYEDAMEVESSEFHASEKHRSITQRIFDFSLNICNYLAVITGILYVFRWIFDYNGFILANVNFNTILLCVFIYASSLTFITQIVRIFAYIIRIYASEGFQKKISSSYRWLSLSIWYFTNIIVLGYIKPQIKNHYFYVRAYLRCGFIGSICYAAVTILMEYFYEYFIQKSLFAKMRDVDIRERIIVAMKNYRYEINTSSTTTTIDGCHLDSIFEWFSGEVDQNDNEVLPDDHVELRKWDSTKVGNLYFKQPELQSLVDAKTLSKDVFEKASEGEERLSFMKFANIFPNTQIAIQSFQFFDTDDERKIGKKEFRDTIISFYVDRLNLEKNFIIAKGFVRIIGDFFSIFVFIFLVLIWLIIFGVPVKELIGLALSSALLLHFMVSGVASEIYYNFMMLLSHPFDIGDDIIIDGVDFKVYKIGLTSSSFIGTNGGKVKFLNSALWKTNLINMTRAPEKILLFKFDLSKDLDLIRFGMLRSKIHQYLRTRPYDFYETYSLETKSESSVDINRIEAHLVLKCKSYKTRSKKFNLRVEVTRMLRDVMTDLNLLG